MKEQEITLNNGKVVEFKSSWTYKMEKEYNQILLEGVKLSENTEEIQKQIPIQNFQKAEESIVLLLTNVTEEDLEEISLAEFNNIKEKCQRIKEGSNK